MIGEQNSANEVSYHRDSNETEYVNFFICIFASSCCMVSMVAFQSKIAKIFKQLLAKQSEQLFLLK